MPISDRFVEDGPSAQNIADIFEGEWSSCFPAYVNAKTTPGHAPLFTDARMHWAWSELGPFKGLDILELGPLEGAHSYMLEHLGARSVVAVEGNTRAFLKCLCVKEIFGMEKVRFKLGSFIPFLEQSANFDLIVASGVLYHMTDPLRLLDLICSRSNRIFVWTHYYDSDTISTREDRNLFNLPEVIGNTLYRASKRSYPENALTWPGFSGGPEAHALWLERDSLVNFFKERGFEIAVGFDHRDHPNGPALAICAIKSDSA